MARRWVWFAGVVAIALAGAGEPDGMESFDALHARLNAAQPAAFPFEVRLPRGRGPYRRGEPIPLELRFGAASGPDSRIDEASRPADIQWEWAEVDGPAGGWIDPLDAELSFVPWRGACGNVSRSRLARTMAIHLNEWVFFRKAGRFRFFLRSERSWGSALESVSEIQEVDIIEPDAAWAQRHWLFIMQRWEDAAARAEAARDLRYLGAPDAAEFVARRFGQSHSGYESFLLISPAEALMALRAAPAEVRRQPGYLALRNLTWMRLLSPFRVRYGPGRRFNEASWRSRLETQVAYVNRALVWIDWF